MRLQDDVTQRKQLSKIICRVCWLSCTTSPPYSHSQALRTGDNHWLDGSGL